LVDASGDHVRDRVEHNTAQRHIPNRRHIHLQSRCRKCSRYRLASAFGDPEPTDATDFANATTAVTLTVNQQPQTISLSSSTQAYASGVMFGQLARLGMRLRLQGFLLPSASSLGRQRSRHVVDDCRRRHARDRRQPGRNANYLPSPVTESIIVNKALPVAAIAPASTRSWCRFGHAARDHRFGSGTPTGTVTFMMARRPLGTGTLASGVATLTSVRACPPAAHDHRVLWW